MSTFMIYSISTTVGNGALDWDDVRPVMEKYLAKVPLQIYMLVIINIWFQSMRM